MYIFKLWRYTWTNSCIFALWEYEYNYGYICTLWGYAFFMDAFLSLWGYSWSYWWIVIICIMQFSVGTSMELWVHLLNCDIYMKLWEDYYIVRFTCHMVILYVLLCLHNHGIVTLRPLLRPPLVHHDAILPPHNTLQSFWTMQLEVASHKSWAIKFNVMSSSQLHCYFLDCTAHWQVIHGLL